MRLCRRMLSVVVLLLTSGSPGELAWAARQSRDFKFHLRVAPETLNPLFAHDNYTIYIQRWMVESLLTRDPDTYAWRPRLASSYDVSQDGKRFTFDLRRDVHFHDGKPLTADDVVFSFEVNHLRPQGITAQYETLTGIERVEKLGDFKVRFHASDVRFSNFDALADMMILPKHIYADPESKSRLARKVVGTGPYRFASWDNSLRLVLERNSEWWGTRLPENADRYNFTRILVRVVPDETLKLQMLEKGELDFAEIGDESALKRTHSKAWGTSVMLEHTRTASQFTTQPGLYLNLRLPIFKSLKTRQAMQHLLNRPLLNETLYAGHKVEATGPWHRLSEYADPSINAVPYDKVAASRLLKAEGWIDSDGDGVLDRSIDGVKRTFRFKFLYVRKDQERYLSVWQADLRAAGIVMDLQMVDWPLFMKQIDELKFDAFVLGRGWPNVIDFNPRYDWFSKLDGPNESNAIGYKNTKVDELLLQAERELNRDERRRLLRKVYRMISEDQPFIYFFSDPETYYGRAARVKGDRPHKFLFDISEWWTE